MTTHFGNLTEAIANLRELWEVPEGVDLALFAASQAQDPAVAASHLETAKEALEDVDGVAGARFTDSADDALPHHIAHPPCRPHRVEGCGICADPPKPSVPIAKAQPEKGPLCGAEVTEHPNPKLGKLNEGWIWKCAKPADHEGLHTFIAHPIPDEPLTVGQALALMDAAIERIGKAGFYVTYEHGCRLWQGNFQVES
jgi:hypothetical protein